MAAPAAVGEIKGLHLLFEKVAPAPAAAGAQADPLELYADSDNKLYRINALQLVKVKSDNLTDVGAADAHTPLTQASEAVIAGKGYIRTESMAVKEAREALRILQRELGGEGGGLRGGLAEAIERLERCCPPGGGGPPGVGGAQPPPAGAQPPPAGAQPPPAGAQPPAAGAQPPPPAGGQPPPVGAQPPAAPPAAAAIVVGGDDSEKIWGNLVGKVREIEASNDDAEYGRLLEDFKVLLNDYIISNINGGCEDPVTDDYKAMLADVNVKLFDKGTKNLQEKLEEIYEMTRKLYKKEENPKTNVVMSQGDIYNAIMGGDTDDQGNIIEEGYINNVFDKLKQDGKCKPPIPKMEKIKAIIKDTPFWANLQDPIMEYIQYKVNELCGKDVDSDTVKDLYVQNKDVRDAFLAIETEIDNYTPGNDAPIIDAINKCITEAHNQLEASGVCAAPAAAAAGGGGGGGGGAAGGGGGGGGGAAADKAREDLLAEYEGKCSSITEIKSDGLCFYRAILTSLGENSDDIASKDFAAQIGDWLENNKATEVNDNGVITQSIQKIYDDNFTGEEFTVFYNNVGGNKQQLTLDQYIEKSQDFSKSKDACCPMVYAEAIIAGHAAANLKDINIIIYDTNNKIISLYTPIKGISDRTAKLQHKDGNHFNVCNNDDGQNNAVKPRKRRQSGGSRNRRITPIGKKIGGISLKKRTPKSKKKSRSKK